MTKDDLKAKYHEILNELNGLIYDLNNLTLTDDFKKYYPAVDATLSQTNNPLTKLFNVFDDLDDLL